MGGGAWGGARLEGVLGRAMPVLMELGMGLDDAGFGIGEKGEEET
jgi:hypothetical protein